MPPLNEAPPAAATGPAYWRSLDHLADTAEFRAFMHREFPAGASELLDTDDRRHFLKIMGASMALAGLGLAGCRRWPDEHIAPYAARPAGRDPGVPVHFASCYDYGGVADGVLVTSFDGRPTKIEGNPGHPTSHGAAGARAQASVLDLYDPDRSRGVLHEGEASSRADFEAWAISHFQRLRNARGGGLVVLSEASSSPSVETMKRAFRAAFRDAEWIEYEPLINDHEVAGTTMAFGAPYRVHHDFEPARTVVALDADFLSAHRNASANIRGFARSRRDVDGPNGSMSRLYAFESDMSLTGANADHRVAVRSSDVAVVAARLAHGILGDGALQWANGTLPASAAAIIDRAAEDLREHRGRGVIVAGPRQPAEVHYLVHLMNEALGNVGRTVSYTRRSEEPKHLEAISALAGRRKAIGTLVIIGGNPAYDAPADLGFASVIENATTSVHLSPYVDETSALCTWHVNRAHYLESWGDGRAWDGTFSIGQPLIEPLFDGVSVIELLALVNGDSARDGLSIVQRTFAEMLDEKDEAQWRRTLHDGMLSGSAATPESPPVDRGALGSAAAALQGRAGAGDEGWELVFAQHPTLYDGRFANNGWLQETPGAVSKLTWDNAVIMSPASAETLGVTDGDLVRIERTDAELDLGIEAAVLRLPGLAEGSVTLHLGGGRRFEGRICAGAGFDFSSIRTSESMWIARGASITKAGGRRDLALTQDHHAIDVNTVGGRGIQSRLPSLFREATFEELQDPHFHFHGAHVVHRLSQWEENKLHGEYAWGMSVDLNACVGCGECIVACQAENNIPIVGKEQVIAGREMHWLRVDRYFSFPQDADGGFDASAVQSVALQPVMCMHCENAPCEQVCPVAATVHDEDGLNVMVYNRCVGTRYCSNNCPYKVRRFNYFDWHRRDPHREAPGVLLQVDPSYFTRPQATPDELRQLQFNPEVTVRMRGVMEKCTFCVQRIADGKIRAKNAYAERSVDEKEALKDQRVEIPDGSITPACAQTCPAEALVFGDLNDPGSRVARRQQGPRAYEMLEELNVNARTKYLARIRNPVPGTEAGHGGEGQTPGHSNEEPAGEHATPSGHSRGSQRPHAEDAKDTARS